MRAAAGLSAERLRAMDQVVSQSTARNRFQTLLLAIFAAVSILLASIGLYGVIAFSIRQRTREFGIRLALGADQLHLRRLIAGQALALTLGGILAGLVASLTVTRLLAGMLFGVQPNDPLTLASAALLLILVALLGSLLPAWRTGRIDPAAALRGE